MERWYARAGGEADKLGNTFESAWTVHQMLRVLAGRAAGITVEEAGQGGEGSEFTLTTLHQGDEAHQVKRKQRGTANGWTPHQLNNEASSKQHVVRLSWGDSFILSR